MKTRRNNLKREEQSDARVLLRLMTNTQKFSVFLFFDLPAVLEGKVRAGEKKSEALAKEKMRVEAELESMTKKSHDASGQLVHISQELLKKERYHRSFMMKTYVEIRWYSVCLRYLCLHNSFSTNKSDISLSFTKQNCYFQNV